MKFILVAISLLFLSGCWESCEEQGGQLKFIGFIYIYNPAIKTIQLYPQYRCEFNEPPEQ